MMMKNIKNIVKGILLATSATQTMMPRPMAPAALLTDSPESPVQQTQTASSTQEQSFEWMDITEFRTYGTYQILTGPLVILPLRNTAFDIQLRRQITERSDLEEKYTLAFGHDNRSPIANPYPLSIAGTITFEFSDLKLSGGAAAEPIELTLSLKVYPRTRTTHTLIDSPSSALHIMVAIRLNDNPANLEVQLKDGIWKWALTDEPISGELLEALNRMRIIIILRGQSIKQWLASYENGFCLTLNNTALLG